MKGWANHGQTTVKAMWRPHLPDLPEGPGVYLFRDARGDILYIGKARCLRRRIASYFHRRRVQPRRLRRLAARTRAVTVHETGSELEALLLESRLLKQERPPFNRLSTTYVALPFVKLTLAEPFPRLLLTREFVPDGGHYLGPFPRFDIAATVLAALQRSFALRSCEVTIVPGVSPQPCEAWQLRKCVAPCAGPQAASLYGHQVEGLLGLLGGGYEAIVQRLKEERQRAADALFFERARHLHTLQTALVAATAGRPLTLLPVAWRHMLVLFQPDSHSAREVFYIRHGLLAARLERGAEGGEPSVAHPYAGCDSAPTIGTAPGSDAMVDELRIVAGWLQRTRARARWVLLDPQMSPAAALEKATQV